MHLFDYFRFISSRLHINIEISSVHCKRGKPSCFHYLLIMLPLCLTFLCTKTCFPLSKHSLPHFCFLFNLFCQVYNADGEFLFKFGSHGEGNGQFNAPTGVAVDANGNIIVADWGNSRIQVGFRKTTSRWPLGGEILKVLESTAILSSVPGIRQLRVLPVLH